MWLLHNRIVFLLAFFCGTLFFAFVFTKSITQTQNNEVDEIPEPTGISDLNSDQPAEPVDCEYTFQDNWEDHPTDPTMEIRNPDITRESENGGDTCPSPEQRTKEVDIMNPVPEPTDRGHFRIESYIYNELLDVWARTDCSIDLSLAPFQNSFSYQESECATGEDRLKYDPVTGLVSGNIYVPALSPFTIEFGKVISDCDIKGVGSDLDNLIKKGYDIEDLSQSRLVKVGNTVRLLGCAETLWGETILLSPYNDSGVRLDDPDLPPYANNWAGDDWEGVTVEEKVGGGIDTVLKFFGCGVSSVEGSSLVGTGYWFFVNSANDNDRSCLENPLTSLTLTPSRVVDGLKNDEGRLVYDALDEAKGMDIITIDNDDGTKSHYAFVASKGDMAVQFIDIPSVFRNTPIESVDVFDGGTLKLNGAIDVSALTIEDDVYAIAVSTGEGVQALRLDKNQNGSFALNEAGNLGDAALLYLAAPKNITTATVNSTPYAFVSSSNEGGVQALRLDKNQDKSLTLAPAGKINYQYDGNGNGSPDGLKLQGASKSAIAEIGNSTYALVAAEASDGVQALRLEEYQKTTITPIPVGNIKEDDNPTGLVLQGTWDITTTTIDGIQYALVAAATDNGVQVIDISNPLSPTAAGSITYLDAPVLTGIRKITTTTIGITQYALVTSYNSSGVQIIDISNPNSPVAVGSITDTDDLVLGGVWGITTTTIGTTQYALVASENDNGVQIIDISNPNSPVAVGSITDTDDLVLGGAWDITTTTIGTKQYALVTSRGTWDSSSETYVDSGVQIIDISNPNSPTAAGSIKEADDPDNLVLAGVRDITTTTIDGIQYALVSSENDNGVQVIDISNPNSPTAAGKIVDTRDLALRHSRGITTTTTDTKQYALVASWLEGVQIIDISNPSSPTAVGGIVDTDNLILDQINAITTTTIDGTQYALVTSWGTYDASISKNVNSGVQIIDISNEKIFNEISFTPAGSITDTNDLELSGAREIATTTIGTTPYAFVSSYDDDGVQALRLDKNQDKSLTLTPTGNIDESYDVDGDPTTNNNENDLELDGPREIATTAIGNNYYALVASEDDNGVQILDISDPSSITPVTSISDGVDGFTELYGPWGIDIRAISNTLYAFVSSGGHRPASSSLPDYRGGVQIINISNPNSQSTTADSTIESKTSIVVVDKDNVTETPENDSSLRFFRGPSSAKVNSYIRVEFSCGVTRGLTSVEEDLTIIHNALKDSGFLLPSSIVNNVKRISNIPFGKGIVVALTKKFLTRINSGDSGITCVDEKGVFSDVLLEADQIQVEEIGITEFSVTPSVLTNPSLLDIKYKVQTYFCAPDSVGCPENESVTCSIYETGRNEPLFLGDRTNADDSTQNSFTVEGFNDSAGEIVWAAVSDTSFYLECTKNNPPHFKIRSSIERVKVSSEAIRDRKLTKDIEVVSDINLDTTSMPDKAILSLEGDLPENSDKVEVYLIGEENVKLGDLEVGEDIDIDEHLGKFLYFVPVNQENKREGPKTLYIPPRPTN